MEEIKKKICSEVSKLSFQRRQVGNPGDEDHGQHGGRGEKLKRKRNAITLRKTQKCGPKKRTLGGKKRITCDFQKQMAHDPNGRMGRVKKRTAWCMLRVTKKKKRKPKKNVGVIVLGW